MEHPQPLQRDREQYDEFLDLGSYNQSDNMTRIKIHCSNMISTQTSGAEIELFTAIFTLLNGGLSSELEQTGKKVPEWISFS